MATYRELQDQIEKLQREAAAARREEIGSTIREIGLTAADLGLAPAGAAPGPRRGRKAVAKPDAAAAKGGRGRKGRKPSAAAGKKVAPKYRGPNGETWTGRGRQPGWVAAAVGAGRTLDDMLIR